MGKVNPKQIIEALALRYPNAFSLVPYKVVPIFDGIEIEIFEDLGNVPRDFKKAIYTAVSWYRSRPSYLMSLLTESGKKNLKGNVMCSVTFEDKQKARAELIQRGSWTPRLAKLYKSRVGAMDATNK